MAIEEKRKHSRIDSLHLLNYIHYGDSEDDATQGMGRTLNVSESGILLETHVSIDVDHTVQLTIGIEENVVDIKGSVVYSQKNAKGMYESGIEFCNVDAAAQKVLKAYISEFNAASGR